MGIKKIVKISFLHGKADMSRYISKEFFLDYIFEINNPVCTECDFWIVYGALPEKAETVKVNAKNIFLITAEFDGGYNQKFLNQFQKVFTSDLRLQGDNVTYYHQGQPWFVNDSFDHLYHQEVVKKTKLLSIVVSNSKSITYSRNYKIRYDFALALKNHFGDKIDVFGRGFNEIVNKEDGLLDYKFSVAIENMSLPYNISEKLNDCFLTHTFPLYYNCPNIDRFYNPNAYLQLDITDHAYSIELIEKVLATPNYYEDHLAAIVEAKKKYLLEYSFQGVIAAVIEKFGVFDLPKEKVTIQPDNLMRSKIKLKLIDLIYNKFR